MTSLLNLQKALPSIYKRILGSAFLTLFIRMKYFNRRLFFTNLFIGSHSKEAPNASMTSSPDKATLIKCVPTYLSYWLLLTCPSYSILFGKCNPLHISSEMYSTPQYHKNGQPYILHYRRLRQLLLVLLHSLDSKLALFSKCDHR